MKEQDIEDFSESRQHCDIMFLTLKNENKRYRRVKKKRKKTRIHQQIQVRSTS